MPHTHYTTLISATNLAERLAAAPGSILVFDCRFDLAAPESGEAAYAQGHIPGAHYLHLDRDLSGVKTGTNGRHPLPERTALVTKLASFGLNEGQQVVAYDAHGGMYAARLWWMLRWVGHGAVAVLDGGLPAWQAAGQPVVTDAPAPRARGSIASRPALVTTVDVNAILHNVEHGGKTIVDARAPDRFRGENETIDPVGGHIPGAQNRFFKDNLQPDGRFKTPEQLKAELGAAVGDARDAIMQCGSGVTACHNLLALEVAGMPGAALYPGSWSEWTADPQRAVATGTA